MTAKKKRNAARRPPRAAAYRQQVQAEWTSVATVAAWRKWYPKAVVQLGALTDALVKGARIKKGMRVLDVASGPGDPALHIASVVGSKGAVTSTDLSNEMLSIARENAERAGHRNVSFQQADAHDLPFEDKSFDAVTCRCGAPYFWNCVKALREIRRVLKPRARAAFVCWGPIEASPYFQHVVRPFAKRKLFPSLPADAPSPLRFAEPGTLSLHLRKAGFKAVKEESRVVPTPWPGTPEELWQMLYEVAAFLRPHFDGLDPEDRVKAIGEVIAGFRTFYDGKRTNVPAAIVVAAGARL